MSNFQGYLVKMGGEIFPHQYIAYDTYKTAPNRRLDLDSTRTADGLLKRYVLDHTASTLQFDIRPLEGYDQEIVCDFIFGHLSNEKEKKALVTYWSPDLHTYKSGEMYIPDIEWPIYRIDTRLNKIWYKSVTIKFIEY